MVVITDPDDPAPAAAPGAVQPASDDTQAASPQGGDQENGQQQVEQQPDWKEQLKSTIMRMIFFYMVMNWMKGGNQTTQQTKPASDGSPAPQGGSQAALNIFRPQMYYDFEAYLSSSEHVDFDLDERIWQMERLTYMRWDDGPTLDSTWSIKTDLNLINDYDFLRNNGSLYLHAFFFPTGASPNPNSELYKGPEVTARVHKKLNKIKKRKYQQTHNLLSGDTERAEDREKHGTTEWISHWHPNITISICYDQTAWPRGKIPPPLDRVVHFARGGYKPIVYLNDWWNLQSDYQPINKTDESLELMVTFQPLSLFKLQLYLSQAYNNEVIPTFLQDEEEAEGDKDAMKRMFIETEPWLLALTVVVSISHTVFEMLAFKNDIQFWKTRDNLKGLSIRAVLFNCFCQLIVLLYICDHDTNIMVKFSVGVGLLIELWKVTKCLRFIPCPPGESGFLGTGYTFEEKRKEEDSETSKYDKMAFKYLGMVCFPLMVCYMIYSIIYNEHKGWYSFCLQSAYGFLLTFGFIAMTPQLFINYKLKSTAHLPWRMMTYKALNTFIDDLFAFIIKMPTLYRLGTLRDDLIFFIYLYQKWIYPTDMKRTNEFGLTGDQAEGRADLPDGPESEESKTGKPVEEKTEEPKPIEEKKNE